MPILYAFHSDLLNNTFNGDKDRIVAMATAISSQVSPRNGTRYTVQKFLSQCRELFTEHYGSTAGTDSPKSIIESMRGPVSFTFGRNYTEFSDNGVNGTSAYVMVPPKYTYSGYSADYQSDLTDGYYYTTEAGEYGGEGLGPVESIGTVTVDAVAGETTRTTSDASSTPGVSVRTYG